MNLCDIREIKALLNRHGFHFSKSMGQNFLIADWVPQEIAQASGAGPDSGVLEIGPGIGPLTCQLARRAGKVVAVELDRTLLPVLAETLSEFSNVEIVPGDVMKLDLSELTEQKMDGLRPMACANLPYNITTPVLTKLLESRRFSAITVMIQREVAAGSAPRPVPQTMARFRFFVSTTPNASFCSTSAPSVFSPLPR